MGAEKQGKAGDQVAQHINQLYFSLENLSTRLESFEKKSGHKFRVGDIDSDIERSYSNIQKSLLDLEKIQDPILRKKLEPLIEETKTNLGQDFDEFKEKTKRKQTLKKLVSKFKSESAKLLFQQMRDQEIPFQEDVKKVLGGHKDYTVVEQNFEEMKEVLKKFETKDGVDYSHLPDEAIKIWAKAFSVQLLKEQIGPEHMKPDAAAKMVLDRQKVQLKAMQDIVGLIESANSKVPEIEKDYLRKTRSKSASAPTPSSKVIVKPRSHSESEIRDSSRSLIAVIPESLRETTKHTTSIPLAPLPPLLSEMGIEKTPDAYAKWMLNGVTEKDLSLRIGRVKIQFPDVKDQEAICLKVGEGIGKKDCKDFKMLQEGVSELAKIGQQIVIPEPPTLKGSDSKLRAMSLPSMSSRARVEIREEAGKTRERSTSLPASLSDVQEIGKKVSQSAKTLFAKVTGVIDELPKVVLLSNKKDKKDWRSL